MCIDSLWLSVVKFMRVREVSGRVFRLNRLCVVVLIVVFSDMLRYRVEVFMVSSRFCCVGVRVIRCFCCGIMKSVFSSV